MSCSKHAWFTEPSCFACRMDQQAKQSADQAQASQANLARVQREHSAGANRLAALAETQVEQNRQMLDGQEREAAARRAHEKLIWESTTAEGKFFRAWSEHVSPLFHQAHARQQKWIQAVAGHRVDLDEVNEHGVEWRRLSVLVQRYKRSGYAIAGIGLIILLFINFFVGVLAIAVGIALFVIAKRHAAEAREPLKQWYEWRTTSPEINQFEGWDLHYDRVDMTELLNVLSVQLAWRPHEVQVNNLLPVGSTDFLTRLEDTVDGLPKPYLDLLTEFRALDSNMMKTFPRFPEFCLGYDLK